MQDLERYIHYYENLPPEEKLIFDLAMWACGMTKSKSFYALSILAIIFLVLMAAIIDVEELKFIAGMGVGGIIVVMVVVTILGLFINSES